MSTMFQYEIILMTITLHKLFLYKVLEEILKSYLLSYLQYLL